MKKSIRIGFLIFVLITTLLIGSAYSAEKVFIYWDVKIKAAEGSDEYSLNMPLKAVKVMIMAEAGLSPSLTAEYGIYKAGGPMVPPILLDENKTLEELGITDATNLIIKPYP